MDARDEHGRTGCKQGAVRDHGTIGLHLDALSPQNSGLPATHSESAGRRGFTVLKVSTAIPAIHPEILVPAFNPPQIADIAVPSDWVPVPIAGLPHDFRLERRTFPAREYRLGFKGEWHRTFGVQEALVLAHQLEYESHNEGDPSSGVRPLSPGMEEYPFAAIGIAMHRSGEFLVASFVSDEPPVYGRLEEFRDLLDHCGARDIPEDYLELIWDLSAINFGLLIDLNASNPWGLFYDRGFQIRGFADDLNFLAHFISTPEFRRSLEVLTTEAPAFH